MAETDETPSVDYLARMKDWSDSVLAQAIDQTLADLALAERYEHNAPLLPKIRGTSDALLAERARRQLSALTSRVEALEAENARFALLKQAVNESTTECLPGCDSHGHEGECPGSNPARWLIDQQAAIARLTEDRDAAIRTAWNAGYDAAIGLPTRFTREDVELMRSLAKAVCLVGSADALLGLGWRVAADSLADRLAKSCPPPSPAEPA